MSAERIDVLAADLRRICGHDSWSVDDCVTCEAADKIESDHRRVSSVDATNVFHMVASGRISGRISEWPQLRKASAAVAELIAADEVYDIALSRYFAAFSDGPHGDFGEQREASTMLRVAKDRRAAALARVQGEGA